MEWPAGGEAAAAEVELPEGECPVEKRLRRDPEQDRDEPRHERRRPGAEKNPERHQEHPQAGRSGEQELERPPAARHVEEERREVPQIKECLERVRLALTQGT